METNTINETTGADEALRIYRERREECDEPEYRCEVSEDTRCRMEATRVVREPYTPKAFKVLCCESCAQDLIQGGYMPDAEEDKKLAKEKAAYEAREYADMMDAQMSEAERLGER